MKSKRSLERVLSEVDPFDHPRIDLEQYPTPPEIAAQLVHIMHMRADIQGRPVVDLGAGTGILTLGASFYEPDVLIAIERDRKAIEIARHNERIVGPPVGIHWVLADVMDEPMCIDDATVVMNPPFGAQRDNIHADRAFLRTAQRIGIVSYSFHNVGSQAFLDAYASDNGGDLTDVWAVEFDLKRQFEFHEAEKTEIEVEAVRIEWDQRLL